MFARPLLKENPQLTKMLQSDKMKGFIILLLTIYSSDGRTVPDEVIPENPALSFDCHFRTLQGGDPYPSVVVKWQNEVQRLTWNSDGEAIFERNYKQPISSHSYPSSSGLSGDGTTTTVNPFVDAPVIPDNYTWDDIFNKFVKMCRKPY